MTDEMIEVNIYPPNYDDGECIVVMIHEKYIMTLVECLDKGYSVKYNSQRRIGDYKKHWIRVRIVKE